MEARKIMMGFRFSGLAFGKSNKRRQYDLRTSAAGYFFLFLFFYFCFCFRRFRLLEKLRNTTMPRPASAKAPCV